ncbi:piggyBac transposable element-derived protein 4 [Halyomorpha halys]|uniref:piggyBac transposable element-derived protein 4 n=1 Tax=Halyomorpha halys TaxID=286706 RepID=UPI0006D4DCA3|nr:piggyBac transposable element-derived protein 4-like [Halyomorpha halys]
MGSKIKGLFHTVEEILHELKRQEEESDENISDYDPDETCSETDDVLLLNQEDQDGIYDADDMDEDVGLSYVKEESKKEERRFELGKDLETVWTDKPLVSKSENTTETRFKKHHVGPKGGAKGLLEERKLFDLFITNEMIEPIVTHSNKEMEKISSRLGTKQYYTSPTDTLEIKALIGLLYISAIFKKSGLSSSDMFSPIYGPPIFRSAMTKNRFDLLLRVLRFDDKETREDRKATDKFAAFREMWEQFQKNCLKYYTPSENLTVDRTLLSFRGKCPFKAYSPIRRDKCGLMTISMCDAMTFYYLGGVPYIKNEKSKGDLPKAAQYVLELAQPFVGSGRNITCDSWFSSFELVDELLRNKLTMVGSLRKNKQQIPPSMMLENSTRFLYHPDKMIVSFSPQCNKHELLISSKHFTNEINRDTSKPKIVEYYNSTKGGVDVLNKLCRDKTTRKRTRR